MTHNRKVDRLVINLYPYREMISDFELLELLSAKFCHDLAGPIGAINNGVEFLQEKGSPEMVERAVQLIEISAKEAVNRLQFYRQAYGAVPSIGEANLDNLKTLASNFFIEGKVKLDWSDSNANTIPISISHKTAKLLLNIVLICSQHLIHGGTLSIRFQKQPTGMRIKISGEGVNMKIDQDALKLLLGKTSDIPINSRNVHPYYTARLTKESGVALSVEQGTDNIHYIIDKKR